MDRRLTVAVDGGVASSTPSTTKIPKLGRVGGCIADRDRRQRGVGAGDSLGTSGSSAKSYYTKAWLIHAPAVRRGAPYISDDEFFVPGRQ